MFTGIVTATGSLAAAERSAGQARFRIAAGGLDLTGLGIGDSIAVNGVCLTVIEFDSAGFSADLSGETLELTTLGEAEVGAEFNLERALALGDELGGHLVTGHVDGIGTVVSLEPAANSLKLIIEAPAELAPFIAQKGSVCVDGTSLTVNRVDGTKFELMIVPHTQEQTIIAGYARGTRVNIEVDIIARYVARLAAYPAPGGNSQ
jgi:riboflavin synthase